VPDVAVPLALVTFYGVVQAFYLRAPSPEDGMNYFERAAAFPNITEDHWSLRIGLFLPVRGLQLLFGYSEAAYYGFPLLAAAGLVLATYFLGARLFNPVVGAGATVLLVLNGVFLNSASVLLPDPVGTSLFTIAILLVVIAATDPGAPIRHRAGLRRPDALLLTAGLLLGWAYLAREFIVIGFPLVAVVFWVYRFPWRRILWVAVPPLAVFAGEVLLNAFVYGKPFARVVESGGHGGQRDYIHDSRLDALIRLPRALAETPGGTPVLVMLALLPFALFFLRRPGFRVVLAWFALFWLPLTLGTGLVVPSFRFFIAEKLRYWMPVLPAILLGGVAVVDVAVRALCERAGGGRRRTPRLVAAAVLVTLALVLGLGGTSDDRSRGVYRVNGADQLPQLRSLLADRGTAVRLVSTDNHTARLLRLYRNRTFGVEVWGGRVRLYQVLDQFEDPADIESGLVVVYRPGYRILTRAGANGESRIRPGHSPIREYLFDPPAGWREVVRRADDSLVVYDAGPS
jgi:4-amino-4-deoxy-L-arabinose transferase-like glycosyltransferase